MSGMTLVRSGCICITCGAAALTFHVMFDFKKQQGSHKDEPCFVFAGMPVVQKANESGGFCQAMVKGPLGHLCGGVLLDTSCTKELRLSEHTAMQLGFTASPPMCMDGISSSYITRRLSLMTKYTCCGWACYSRHAEFCCI